jgi:UDP-GlcNAc:undecaprenyl-phosphate GlcNAc-1-phosphate transferase
MELLLALALCAFLCSLIYTPLCRDLFRRLGVFDQPDRDRKIHNEPVPRVGGVVMVLSLGSTYLLILALDGLVKPFVGPGVELAWKILPGAAVVFVTGLLDDLVGLRPWQKLAGQVIGAGWAYTAGLHVLGVAGYSASHWLSLPLTLMWLVLCTNAFNLIDGVDGLATGVGLFATLTMVLAAMIGNNLQLAAVTLPLAGFLLGFLRYNFNPATVFLGDSGSLLVGFLLGCFGVIWSQKSATLLGMTAPLMAMFVPILDVGLSVVRRFLRHQPIFGADRGHIHHRLLDRGWTPRRAVLMLYGVCTLGAVFSIAQTLATQQFSGLVILIFCAATWIGVQHLGYVEFGMASRMLLTGSFQRLLGAQLQLRRFEDGLRNSDTLEALWNQMVEGCRGFGFSGLSVQYDGQRLDQELIPSDGEPGWTIRIPLSAAGLDAPGPSDDAQQDWIHLTRPFEEPEPVGIVAPVVKILRDQLPGKLTALMLESSRNRTALSTTAT